MSKFPLSVPVMHGKEARYLQECVESGWVSSAGPWVDRFEKEFAKAIGMPSAVSVTSGTAALHLALMIAGVRPGDEVLVPTVTFIATVNAVRYAGAEPVFFDCDDFLNIDSEKIRLFLAGECESSGGATFNRKSGKRIAAVLPVHVFGHPARIEEIVTLAEPFNVAVIEDATESLGSLVLGPNGESRSTGTYGHSACFSFNGNKIITTGGGGMIVSRDLAVMKRAKYLSTQAKDDELFFVHDEVGYNYRLTSLQAALGIGQLEALTKIVERKRAIHSRYVKNFSNFREASLIAEPPRTRSNHWMNTLRIAEGARLDLRALIGRLGQRGIQTRPIWKLNHEQKPYLANQGYRIEKATALYPRLLSIPSTSSLTDSEVDQISSELMKTITELLK